MQKGFLKAIQGAAFGLLFLVAACAAPSGETVSATLPNQEEQAALPTFTLEVQPTPAATEVEPPPTSLNQLDAGTTFEVIAALHANILEIEEWLPRGFSVFERQAVVQPLVELSILPLGGILREYTPHSDLAGSWQQAAELYHDFYPQLSAWADGDLDDSSFSDILAGLSNRSSALIAEAGQIAAALDVETSQYGEQYALAKSVVFQLTSGLAQSFDGTEAEGGELAGLQEQPALVVRELNPFIYPFAGMDVFLTIGLLENTGTQAQERVEVEIRFFNFLGEHLGTMTGQLLARVALPGNIYPFSASIVTEGEEEALKDWTRYEIAILSRPVNPGQVTYQDFSLGVSSSRQGGVGGILIEGSLTNQGAQTVALEDLLIGVMALDADGKLVGVGNGAALGGGSLTSGQTAQFQAVIESLSGQPSTYRLFAEVSQ